MCSKNKIKDKNPLVQSRISLLLHHRLLSIALMIQHCGGGIKQNKAISTDPRVQQSFTKLNPLNNLEQLKQSYCHYNWYNIFISLHSMKLIPKQCSLGPEATPGDTWSTSPQNVVCSGRSPRLHSITRGAPTGGVGGAINDGDRAEFLCMPSTCLHLFVISLIHY